MMTQVKTQLTALLVILLLNSTPLSQGLNGTPCSQGSCFAQLPELCGSVTPLPSAPAAALSRLCGGVGDFPYKYDYDPANTSRATFAHYFSDADKTTPVGFARAVLEASFDAANAELGSGCNTTWEAAGPVLQIRAARRFAARTYMLAAETTLDMANVDGIGDLSADAVLSLLLNRTVSGARGFCGFCGVWLARLLNDVVLPSHTKAAAVPLFLANNYPGYPASGGLTHVLNTVPTVLPETGEVVYATQDAYFSYEFVRCDDRHTPLDLREILRAIIARNASDVICVPFPDDRLYFPRLEVAADHVNGNATVELQRTWGAWAQVADKSAPFGAWVNRTLALFGCPTADDDGVGNFYYYLLVAGWGGAVDPSFEADVKRIVCGTGNPCTKAAQHLPLCTPPPPPPAHGEKCCWNRDIQGCSASSQCDPGGEGCVASGTMTKRYGRVACNTCASHGKVYNASCSCCNGS